MLGLAAIVSPFEVQKLTVCKGCLGAPYMCSELAWPSGASAQLILVSSLGQILFCYERHGPYGG